MVIGRLWYIVHCLLPFASVMQFVQNHYWLLYWWSILLPLLWFLIWLLSGTMTWSARWSSTWIIWSFSSGHFLWLIHWLLTWILLGFPVGAALALEIDLCLCYWICLLCYIVLDCPHNMHLGVLYFGLVLIRHEPFLWCFLMQWPYIFHHHAEPSAHSVLPHIWALP